MVLYEQFWMAIFKAVDYKNQGTLNEGEGSAHLT
jgi:hypothetical protein